MKNETNKYFLNFYLDKNIFKNTNFPNEYFNSCVVETNSKLYNEIVSIGLEKIGTYPKSYGVDVYLLKKDGQISEKLEKNNKHFTDDLKTINKTFEFTGYDSGNYESHCFDVHYEDFMNHSDFLEKGEQYYESSSNRGFYQLYISDLMQHLKLDPEKQYRFKISIEAEEI